ncbi:alpha-2-macroglobulin [Proteiniphilum sp. X52]|uniref:alpha-2-macroglobulin family protein n=1 Tax=Proteiniphilum sp. X52 TaxID=2382159 RepID=UPI000F0A5474|nr:alpha-2-macroglobulin family protein [Proteiniphilum sp. X52]RNC66860.1 hypothetical protein D7D25_00930 [Proteiniphilum sp. X52]
MNKIYLTLLLVALASGVFSQTKRPMNRDHYANEWAKVADFEKKSLPRSAADVVNTILQQAVKDRNSPQIIKALIHQGKYDLTLDAQNDTLIFRNLNEMLEKSSDVVEQSVLHSMLAELYLQYYQKDRWNIDQRTDLGDFVPADMKEWTRNIFFHKVVEHLDASVAAEGELVEVKVESYAAVVELGKASRRFYPAMYDFLVRRAIELSGQIDQDEDLSRVLARKNIPRESLFAPADEFVKLSFTPQQAEYGLLILENYRKLLSSLLRRNMDSSVLLVELEKSDYLRDLSYSTYISLARPALEKLLAKWEGNEMSVEIIDKLSQFYLLEVDQTNAEDTIQRREKTAQVYELLKKTIAAFPKYERISILQNRLSQLTQPAFTVTGAGTFPKEGDKELKVNFKNIGSLTAKLYRIHSPVEMLEEKSKVRGQIAGKRVLIKEIPISLPDTPEYWQGETTFTVNPGGFGSYMLTFSSSPGTNDTRESDYYFSVSDMAVFARGYSDNQYDFFVVDRTTGIPVPDAKVDIYKLPANWNNSKLTLDQSITTNALGLAVYHKKIPNNDVFYHAVSGNDKGAALTRLPSAFYSYSDRTVESREMTNIFTDRSLYRPGQTVYFKAIQVRRDAGRQSVIAGKPLEIVLRDANNREISKRTFTTNEFGSIAGEFVLPRGVLPGHFTIGSGEGTVGFRVEEYKRPTFEVRFDKIEKTYQFGEEITLKGKAESFSGISLQQANVEYDITRMQLWWRIWNGRSSGHYASGSVTTGQDGGFEITFTPEKPDSQASSKVVYAFEVAVAVTDINGETQTGYYTVTVGDVSMMLSLDMPDRWAKESDEKIIISAKNLDDNDVTTGGTYRIFSLQENDSIGPLSAEGEFKTGEQPALKKQLSGLPSGKYRVKLESKDDRGNSIVTEKDIILFSYSDKRPPIKTNEWLVQKNSNFSRGKDAEVILGVSDKVHVLHELWQGDKLLERKWIGLDNENRLFSIPYKEQYKEGVTLMLTYIKDEKFYAHRVDLLPEKEETDLKVKLDVFRDKIRPGAEEEWRITVTGADNNPALAEVLASMYDFSLDKIYVSSDWYFSPFSYARYFSRMGFSTDQSFHAVTAHSNIPVQWKNVTAFEFDRFHWFGYSLFYSGRMMVRSAKAGNAQLQMYAGAEEIILAEDLAGQSSDRAIAEEIEITSGEGAQAPPPAPASRGSGQENEALQIRRDFNETAFFFPHLKTNSKGETQIAFTVPESNTKWRFRVLAHDKELNTGKAEAFTVSQKELMVTPNLPRFLRHGDRTAISTKISNLSDGSVNGNVKLEFFDPVTEEVIHHISIENREQLFSLARGASWDAWWTFDVPADVDILGVRILASSEQFSDGEQHALAVLPNRMLVTESMRMDLNGGQTKQFSMNRLVDRSSETIQDYRLTLEFTSNPAWYAIQALPVLGEPDSDNAVSWFASYYANSLGAHIGQAFPKVKAMVEAWKKQGGSKETLLSNLEKNQELKSVLLEETPWVLEARNESEQKARLSLLFDLNRSRDLTGAAIHKLWDLQTNQGGWSWFKGFHPSVSITQYILHGFHQLKRLGAAESSQEILSMQEKAVFYIDTEAQRRFEALKKYNKEWKNIKTISTTDLEYLYVRSGYSGYPLDKEGEKMTDFYLSIIEKNWTQYGSYERALIAMLMGRKGKTGVVESILASFREHATRSGEMGIYWANNRAQVFMSQSAVSVHTFIMDAFRIGGAKADEMDEMKRWLLKQKQTQLWETTHATADAVYTLLNTGSDWFIPEGETTVTLGELRVEPENKEPGSGYFKESWYRAEVTPGMGEVTVRHQGNTPAWGALYWQYFEDMDKIEKTDASLDVEKQLFVEQATASGPQLVRITQDSPLRVGDKVVVRLTVRSDRDLEFVHLKDMRAAAFEPVNQISAMGWQNGIPYYQTSKDASTGFYFDHLPRGTYLFEYAVYVSRPGNYSNGITTIQSMYAPEFTSHTAGMKIIVKE